MERLAALRRVLIFKALPESILTAVAQAGCERRMTRGELLFAEGEHCLGLIVVLSGAVKVYKLDNRGRELTLDRELPGESVVELPLFDGGNYPASAEAAEEETTIFLVERERFRQLMAIYPQIAEQGLRVLAIRMRRLMQMLEAQALHSVRARLAAYLLRVGGEQQIFLLTETNEAIAGHIGTVREVVSRTLHSLREAGAIHLNGRRVTLRDPHLLRKIAEGEVE